MGGAERAGRRRAGRGLGAVALLVALVALAPATTSAGVNPVPTSTCTTTAALSPDSQGTDVACLQFLLGLGGFYHGELTSHYDQATRDAVTAFQVANPPLVASGIADEKTLETMGIFTAPAQLAAQADTCTAAANLPPGSTGDGVACIQRHLATLGLFSGTADGVLGQTTVDAVKAFQAKNPPLTVDGLAGPQTLAALGVWSGQAGGTTVGAQASPGAASPAPMGPWPAPMLDYPNWNLTAQGIPYYGQSTPCSLDDANTIAAQFALNNADVSTQQWAVYIASREGGCRYAAVNYNPATRDDSHCTFQLNAMSGMFEPGGELGRLGWTTDNVKASMAACADAASDLWVYCGKGPWTKPYRCLPPWANDLGAEGDS
ncbi:MAG: peptidoglycan-binding domain-containing protein [Ilumatobacteraceae bacterium]